MESHRVFHWNGTTRIMDAVSLASSEDIKPSQIFFSRREAWDIDQPEEGPYASSAISRTLCKKLCTDSELV